MENRATLEVIAPSGEEAIAKGINELGLPEEAIDVEVLDTGSKGLFGIGSRQARVRLIVKSAITTEASSVVPEVKAPAIPQADKVVAKKEQESSENQKAEVLKPPLSMCLLFLLVTEAE